MIGSYLDEQVTNVKNGVLAAGSLLGIGFIIYYLIKKRKVIASAIGLGPKTKAAAIEDGQKPKTSVASIENDNTYDAEIVDIDEEEDGDDEPSNSSSNDSSSSSVLATIN